MSINVDRFLDELEADLRNGDRRRRADALQILRRWVDDVAIELDCRRRARGLLEEFDDEMSRF